MRATLWALVVTFATSAVALAQPQPLPPQPAQPQPPPVGPTQPPPPQPPPPQPVAPQPPPPQPRPEPAPDPTPPMMHHDDGNVRPTEFAIAIGLGYKLPTSLETPNITSVRFRLPSGLTFEPTLVFANTSNTVDTGMPITNEISEVGIGSLVRYPIIKHGRVDFELLGSFNVDQLHTKPEAADQDKTLTTTTLAYGLAVTSWINAHWQLSFTATNALVTSTKNKQENGPGTVTVTTDTTFGLVFDPAVVLMLHLYN